MNTIRTWLIAVLVIGGLVYFWSNDEQSEKQKTTVDKEQPKSPSTQTSPTYQTEFQRNTNPPPSSTPYYRYPQDYGPVEQSYSQYPPHSGYRFRTRDQEYAGDSRVDPYYPQPSPYQEYPIPSQAQEYQPQPGYDMGQLPEQSFRFRPLDEKRTNKRWTGNYDRMKDIPPQTPPGGYEYDPYNTPRKYQPPNSHPRPLWADSWPER